MEAILPLYSNARATERVSSPALLLSIPVVNGMNDNPKLMVSLSLCINRKGTAEALMTVKLYLSRRFLTGGVLIVSLPLLIFPIYTTVSLPELRSGAGDGCERGVADFVLSTYTGGYIGVFLWLSFKLQVVFVRRFATISHHAEFGWGGENNEDVTHNNY